MAKATRSDKLYTRLRAQGLRKRTANIIARGTDRRRNPAKSVQSAIKDLKRLVAETEDRLSGGPAKRKAAAKKAAATRKRNAARRSAAATRKRNAARRSATAKKGARTRAKSS
jgi:hypothetical protein